MSADYDLWIGYPGPIEDTDRKDLREMLATIVQVEGKLTLQQGNEVVAGQTSFTITQIDRCRLRSIVLQIIYCLDGCFDLVVTEPDGASRLIYSTKSGRH